MSPLDDLDAIIIRETVWRPTDPHHAARGVRRPWDIARALGLHGTTVKRRIADMREKGLLRGVYLQPAPALVQRQGSEHHLAYRDTAAKRRAFESLVADPAVWECYSFVGNALVVLLATPEAEDHRETVARLARETGAVGARFHHAVHWDPPVERVSALDLRIMAAFAEDAFRPVSDVAAEVGIAPKTVTSRMRSLAGAGAFMIHPHIDYRRTNGGMTIYLDLALALGASEGAHVEIANRFPLALCRSTRGAENAYVVLHAADAEDVESILSRAQTIPGVERVEPQIFHASHHEPARWKDALLQRAEALARAKGVWSASWRAKPDLATTRR